MHISIEDHNVVLEGLGMEMIIRDRQHKDSEANLAAARKAIETLEGTCKQLSEEVAALTRSYENELGSIRHHTAALAKKRK